MANVQPPRFIKTAPPSPFAVVIGALMEAFPVRALGRLPSELRSLLAQLDR